jgi:TonB-dependent starch-binding outer membrane protein SusC
VNNIKITPRFTYGAGLLFSTTTNRVTSPDAIARQAWEIVESDVPTPLNGHGTDALYGYRAAKLDSLTGAPRGYLKGNISEDYEKIRASTDQSSYRYIGSATPTSVLNVLQSLTFLKRYTLSCLVIIRMGYYTRIPALNYYKLFNELSGGYLTYPKRWNGQGPENSATVPALIFPLDKNRDLTYEYNETNFVRADNIRLENVQFSTYLDSVGYGKYYIKRLEFFVSVSNIAILCKSGKLRTDPDIQIGSLPNSRSITVSIKMHI